MNKTLKSVLMQLLIGIPIILLLRGLFTSLETSLWLNGYFCCTGFSICQHYIKEKYDERNS